MRRAIQEYKNNLNKHAFGPGYGWTISMLDAGRAWSFSYGLNAAGVVFWGGRGTSSEKEITIYGLVRGKIEPLIGSFDDVPSLGFSGQPRSSAFVSRNVSEVRAPSAMIAVGDRPGYITLGGERIDVPITSYDSLLTLHDWPRPSPNRVGVSRQHDGKSNVLFADGHIETDTLLNWTLPTVESRRRWNFDYEPH